MEAIDLEKRALRREVLARRDGISIAERERRSAAICDKLKTVLEELVCVCKGAVAAADVRAVAGSGEAANVGSAAGGSAATDSAATSAAPRTVCLYRAIRSEVDLAVFAQAAYRVGCRVAFPCMLPQGHPHAPMVMRAVSAEDYRSGSVPFLERPLAPFAPEKNGPLAKRFPLVAPGEIDFAVVPLVAFDARGARLGYGGGNYDRYLPLLRRDCRVIGIAFEEQRVDRVPTDAHDRPLERIIAG